MLQTSVLVALIDRAYLVVVFGFLVQVGVVVLVHKVPGKPFKRQAAALSQVGVWFVSLLKCKSRYGQYQIQTKKSPAIENSKLAPSVYP